MGCPMVVARVTGQGAPLVIPHPRVTLPFWGSWAGRIGQGKPQKLNEDTASGEKRPQAPGPAGEQLQEDPGGVGGKGEAHRGWDISHGRRAGMAQGHPISV